jgi:hypothetical protein
MKILAVVLITVVLTLTVVIWKLLRDCRKGYDAKIKMGI